MRFRLSILYLAIITKFVGGKRVTSIRQLYRGGISAAGGHELLVRTHARQKTLSRARRRMR